MDVKGLNLGSVSQVKVDGPKSAEGWTTIPIKMKASGGEPVNDVKLAVGDAPEIMEQEPNTFRFPEAQTVSVPVTIQPMGISAATPNPRARPTKTTSVSRLTRANTCCTIEVAGAPKTRLSI